MNTAALPHQREMRLLRILARRCLDQDSLRTEAAALAHDVDWSVLLPMAEYHRLTPIVAHHVLHSGVSVEPTIQQTLDAASRVCALRNLDLTARLRNIVAGLRNISIEVIPYKGPLLAISAWGDLSLRTFVDLDILVLPADVDRAREYLEDNGYSSRYRFNAEQNRRFKAIDGEYPYLRADTETLVELHCRLASKRFAMGMPTTELFERSRTVRLAGEELRTLSAEDLLLSLCMHGSKHRWAALGWVADLAEVLRAESLDWEMILRRAAAIGANRCLAVALGLARFLLDAHVPDDVANRLPADSTTRNLIDISVRHLYAMEFPTPSEMLRYNYQMLERTGARRQFIARWLFAASPEDYDVVRLPPAATALYNVIRPVRLLMRYGF